MRIADPPEVVTRLLGPRPAHLELRPAWDRAVRAIAGYRLQRIIADEAPSVLGPPPDGGPERMAWRTAIREVERAAAESGRSLESERLFEGPERGLEFDP